MSLNSKETVKCPKCGNVSDITVWQSITVSDSLDLKNDLLKGKLNIFQCPECQHRALMPMPLLYHDEEKSLMMSFSPCSSEEKKMELYNDIKKTSKESGDLQNLEGYNLRFVYDYNSLLEKILIFENGLSDKVIEVLKVLILMQKPDNMDNMTAMFGKLEDDFLEFLITDKTDNACYTSKIPMESYKTVKIQLNQSGVKDYSFDWEIVDLEYGMSLLKGRNNSF